MSSFDDYLADGLDVLFDDYDQELVTVTPPVGAAISNVPAVVTAEEARPDEEQPSGDINVRRIEIMVRTADYADPQLHAVVTRADGVDWTVREIRDRDAAAAVLVCEIHEQAARGRTRRGL